MEAAGRAVVGLVAAVAAHALVAAGAEGLVAGAGEDDDADGLVLARLFSAWETSMIVCGRKALCTSGRAIVILAIPSSVVS